MFHRTYICHHTRVHTMTISREWRQIQKYWLTLMQMGYKPFHLKLVFLLSLKKKESKGWAKKKCTNVLLHTAKVTYPRVKSQAIGQNNGSRALKWGIVHFCSSITFRDRTSFIEISVFQNLHFCKKVQKLLC